MRLLVAASALVLSSIPALTTAAVKTEEVTYEHAGTKMKGFIAYDAAKKGPRPGVLVVHEWWGHNDYARKRATMLAEQGYTALALDMYGDGKQAGHPKDAMKFSSKVMGDMAVAKGRFLAAKKILADHASVDGEKIAAIGYCFGGSVVLSMARSGVDLDLVASFHGGLGLPPRTAETIAGEILVFHGGADGFIKPEQIQSFVTDTMSAGAALTFVSYPGAVHAFTNPGADALGKKFKLPLGYDKTADEASWAAFSAKLDQVF